MVAVDDQFDMQAIVHEQHASRGRIRGGAGGEFMRTFPTGQRSLPAGYGGIKESARRRHHSAPARRIKATGAGRRSLQRIGAIKGIIQAAPAGVGGIQQEAGIEHRHHQLRPGHGGNLGVHILRGHGKGCRLSHQIATLAQEGLIFGGIDGFAGAGGVPCVNSGLQIVSRGQKRPVLRRQIGQQGGKPLPEGVHITLQRGKNLSFHKSRQSRINRKTRPINHPRHWHSVHYISP